MVILLSFLSSTEQQQNNVIIVAALAKVLTSFPYSVQFLKAVETRVSYQDSYWGLYVCIWFLIHARSRWLFSGRAFVAATWRGIKSWGQHWIWIRGFVEKKKSFQRRAQMTLTKVYVWGAHYLPTSILVLDIHHLSFHSPLGLESLLSLDKLRLCEVRCPVPPASITPTTRMCRLWLQGRTHTLAWLLGPLPPQGTMFAATTVDNNHDDNGTPQSSC